jgi:hypothetical protein
MILFFQKTWFLWWILAAFAILRWFHLFSSRIDERTLEAGGSIKDKDSTASEQISSELSSDPGNRLFMRDRMRLL